MIVESHVPSGCDSYFQYKELIFFFSFIYLRIQLQNYNTILNNHPSRMMNRAMVPKKMPMSFMFITFLSMVASGNERPTTDIMNAKAVPNATPLATNTCTTGTMPAALAYIGTARTTANGTAYQCSPLKYASKNPLGT